MLRVAASLYAPAEPCARVCRVVPALTQARRSKIAAGVRQLLQPMTLTVTGIALTAVWLCGPGRLGLAWDTNFQVRVSASPFAFWELQRG